MKINNQYIDKLTDESLLFHCNVQCVISINNKSRRNEKISEGLRILKEVTDTLFQGSKTTKYV